MIDRDDGPAHIHRHLAAEQAALPPATLTADRIKGFLAALHENDGGTASDTWIFATELPTSTGMRDKQRLDAWAMHLWPSTGHRRVAYEIKVTRSDFLRELKAPQKRKLGLLHANQFYFAAPRGLIRAEEVPPECGLVEFGEDGRPFYKVAAPHADTAWPSFTFWASVCRAVQRQADARVEPQVRARHAATEERHAAARDVIAHDQQAIRAKERALHDEWQKCRAAQLAAGLPTPPYSLRYTVEAADAREGSPS